MDTERARADLALIKRVVEESRRERARTGQIYVAWGAIILVAIGAFVGLAELGWEHAWLVWPVLCALGGLYSWREGRRTAQNRVQTYGARVEGEVWIATAFATFCVAFIAPMGGLFSAEAIIPIVSLLVGVATATAGALYRLWMLRAAGWLFLACGVACFFVPPMWAYILFAVAMVGGQIVPGVRMVWMRRKDVDV